jgi:membrane protein
MPNTKVRFSSGFSAGILAGTVYQIVQWLYITFQVGVSKYNAIYGSFAALPFFLVWMHISWIIVLLGAEFAFAHQNVETYEFEPDCSKISPGFRMLLSLGIVHAVAKKFSTGETPLSDGGISHTLDIPIRLVRQLLYDLLEAGILSEIRSDDDKERVYQPALDSNLLTVRYVMEALDQRGVNNLPIGQTDDLNRLSKTVDELRASLDKSPANKLLKDL